MGGQRRRRLTREREETPWGGGSGGGGGAAGRGWFGTFIPWHHYIVQRPDRAQNRLAPSPPSTLLQIPGVFYLELWPCCCEVTTSLAMYRSFSQRCLNLHWLAILCCRGCRVSKQGLLFQLPLYSCPLLQ